MNSLINISLFFHILIEDIILFSSNFLICLFEVALANHASFSNSQTVKNGFENSIVVIL
jgi:hypothetical protein